jgi:hypothetical protein
VIAEILVEDSRDVFRGQVGQNDIYEGAHVTGFGVVPGRFHDNLCEIEGLETQQKKKCLSKIIQMTSQIFIVKGLNTVSHAFSTINN